MSKAVDTSITSRRLLLAAAPAALALPGAAAAAPAAANPDVLLIQVCQRFAETEFALWYRYIVEPDGDFELADTTPDWPTLHWIEETPAHTPDGLRAKALAYVAWDREAYDNSPDSHDGHTTLLASLMRDLAAPARAVILARLVEQYGPLPEGYTPDCRYVGTGEVAA